MAAEQYGYYQDPSAYGYGYDDAYGYGYDETYGYGGYGMDFYSQTPLPPPDKNWKDPVKVNKTYLKKIQKDCVQKEYYGLKEDTLYLLETLIESINLKSEVTEKQKIKDGDDTPFLVSVKLLNFPAMKVDKREFSEHTDKETLSSPSHLIHSPPSFSDLFQTMFSATGRHVSLIPNDEPEVDESSPRSSEKRDSKNVEATLETLEKTRTFEIMQGRSTMFVSSGFAMIQNLHQYPIKVSVAHQETVGEDKKDGVQITWTTSVRLPENFRLAVLWSIKPETILPVVVIDHGYHKLVDTQGEEVGEVMLTMALTCFGKAVLNCIRDTEDEKYEYENTTILRTLKSQEISDGRPVDINPSLALELIKLAPPQLGLRTSTEVLRHCLFWKLMDADEKTRRSILKCYDCDWHTMVRNSQPRDNIKAIDIDFLQPNESELILELWRKHRQICRDLKKEEKENPLIGIYRQLEDIQIQTGLAEIKANNPFAELAQHTSGQSQDELGFEYSYESNKKPSK